MAEGKKSKVKKNVLLENVKVPMEAGMLCTIDGDIFIHIDWRLEHHVTSQTTMLVSSTALTSTS